MEQKHLTFNLTGNAHDRRKQFKAIQRQYPDKRVSRCAPITLSDIYGKRVEVEEANVPQTHVIVYLVEDNPYETSKEPEHYEAQPTKDKASYPPQI
jgi:hypothetical protein